MTEVLIVEDEKHLAEGLRFNLEAEGYTVSLVGDGEAALSLLLEQRKNYDLVILDVMLPGKDGFTVANELRASGQFVPVLMLTARGRAEDVLRGFESGADDYLPKPFELSVLLARLKALLRRQKWSNLDRSEATARNSDLFSFGYKTIDFGSLGLRTPRQITRLTLMEADLLRYFVKHEGRVVSRKAILEDVWGLQEDTDTRAIDNFIVRLRRYIEEEPSQPRHLLTVRGVGYRFVASEN
jgi:two-component system, OmpR family, alkaline phosphatase synthesis response regulator PhoP